MTCLSVPRRNSGALGIREAFSEVNLVLLHISAPGGFQELKIGLNESTRLQGFSRSIPAPIIPDHTL